MRSHSTLPSRLRALRPMFQLTISPPLANKDILDWTILHIYLSPILAGNLDGNHSSLARKIPVSRHMICSDDWIESQYSKI
jgi:hypothetical protein